MGKDGQALDQTDEQQELNHTQPDKDTPTRIHTDNTHQKEGQDTNCSQSEQTRINKDTSLVNLALSPDKPILINNEPAMDWA